MDLLDVTQGLPLAMRAQAAALIWDEFGHHIAPGLSGRAGMALVRRALCRDAILIARDSHGRLLGLTGLRSASGGILSDTRLAWSGGWRGWFDAIRFPRRAVRDLVVDALVVAPHARGRGVGRRLVAAALEQAARLGYPGLRAEVKRGNAASLAMFHRAGLTPVARQRFGDVIVLRRAV